MPNWTQNELIIVVDSDTVEDLITDLAGPGDWLAPNYETFMSPLDNLTGHDSVALEAAMEDAARVRDEFRTDNGREDWVPVSQYEARLWKAKQLGLIGESRYHEDTKTVPFSVAKLSPMTKEDLEDLFPGDFDADGWWVRPEDKQSQYNGGRLGWIGLRNRKLGTKWPPSEVRMENEGEVGDKTYLRISYQTPWCPIVPFFDLVRDTFARHNAKALLIWEEEDSNSGFFYINGEMEHEEGFDHGQFSVMVEEDGEEFYDWDGQAFRLAVLESVENAFEDKDFDGWL